MSVDMGQYDAMKSQPRSKEEQERLFAQYKARVELLRMSGYIADYIAEEFERGNTEVDKWMVADAIEAYEGGAR